MPHRLILWDIDGTLLATGRAGRVALELAACRAAGLDGVPEVVMSGKTDPLIVRELLAGAGLGPAEVERVLPRALEESHRILSAAADQVREEGAVHPGVRELLEALSGVQGVRQSLLTGNIAPNALFKVRAFGLDRHLDTEIGAYGTDHDERDGLVPIALERARARRGETYRSDEVWVIGDTARDLSCARAGGVRCLIVGTGHEGFDAVRGLGADAVVENLARTDLALEILVGASDGSASDGSASDGSASDGRGRA
jgi:phosphoglycolate phosphatase-like HAD superfamily hydrolase